MKTCKDWILWGMRYVPTPIKICGGTLGKCRAEMKRRKAEGWTCLQIRRCEAIHASGAMLRA